MNQVRATQIRLSNVALYRKVSITLFVGVLIFIAWAYQDSFFSAATQWTQSDTYAHGWVIVPITLWMVWRKRAEWVNLPFKPSWIALPFVTLAAMVWLLGTLTDVNSVLQFAAFISVGLFLWLVLGSKVAWSLIFPLGYLLLAVPVGDSFLPTLMEQTADFTVVALRLTGIPVYRDGLYFSLSSGNWSVVEACSGQRYLIASVTLGVLFAYLNFSRALHRTLFILVSIVVPIIANWIRAYLIVLIGHLSSMRLAVGVDHLIYGWLFFGLVMAVLFAVGAKWSAMVEANSPTLASHPDKTAPETGDHAETNPFGQLALATTLGVLSVLAAQLSVNYFQDQTHAHSTQSLHLSVPQWDVETLSPRALARTFRSPQSADSLTFKSQNQSVDLEIYQYSSQHQRGEMIAFGNGGIELPPSGVLRRLPTQTVKTLGPHLIPLVRETQVRNVAGREIYVSWQMFWVNGRWHTSEEQVKLHTLLQILRGQGDRSAALHVSTWVRENDIDRGRQTLNRFLISAQPTLEKYFPTGQVIRTSLAQ